MKTTNTRLWSLTLVLIGACASNPNIPDKKEHSSQLAQSSSENLEGSMSESKTRMGGAKVLEVPLERERIHSSYSMGPGAHLWSTGDGGSRVVVSSPSNGTLTITTREPGDVEENEIEEVYSISFRPIFVSGGWNDFVVAGWGKGKDGYELVIERWILKHIDGAYEGDIPNGASPALGVSQPLSWPSGSWRGAYIDPDQRAKRLPPRRYEVLRGGIGSAESIVLDGWMRFVLVASRVDEKVHMIQITGTPTLLPFLTALEVPWLAGGHYDPILRGTCPNSGGVVYGLYADRLALPTSGLSAYIAHDANNDGVIDMVTSEPKNRFGWAKAYPFGSTIAPASIYR